MSWIDLPGWIASSIAGLVITLLWEEVRQRRQRERHQRVERPWLGRLIAGTVGLVVGAAAVAVHAPDDGRAGDDTVEIMVVWTGEEVAQFRRLVADYPGPDVVVRTVGTDIGTDLDASLAKDDPPPSWDDASVRRVFSDIAGLLQADADGHSPLDGGGRHQVTGAR
jgi:hypothetical protein